MNKINNIIPIDDWIEEEALRGSLRLNSNQRPYLIAVNNAEFRGTANFENA